MSYSRFDHPGAWTAAQLGSVESFAITLSGAQRDTLTKALEMSRGIETEALTPDTFALESIAEDVGRWTAQVRSGRGLVMLRNLPVEDLDSDDAARLLFGLGTHFGIAVSQSNLGEKVGHVINVGGQDARERAYRNARSLNLHTDRCDHVGMLCLRPAIEGGLSGYSSALAVHNELLDKHPELLEPLYKGFYLHRFGEQTGARRLTDVPIPVFSVTNGVPNIVYIRGYIDLAVNEGHYALTPLQARALDTFDEIANRPDMRLDVMLQAGDATFINNCFLIHRRDAFVDDRAAGLGRHLLRLWLMDPAIPASDAIRAHKGMQGIEKIEGRGTYYSGHAKAAIDVR